MATEGLLKEIEDKYKAHEEYRADIKFDENLTRWKKYYEGTSDETEARALKKKSAVMPPWAGTSVDHLLARFSVALFMSKPYYGIFPVRDTREGIISAEIAQDLVEFQLTTNSAFNNSVRFLQSILANGLGAIRTGWDFAGNMATLTNWNIKKVYWSPYTEDITQPDWVIFEYWNYFDNLVAECQAFEKRYGSPLYEKLDEVVNLSGMDLDEVLEKYAKMGKKKPIKLWDYWDVKKRVVVAGKKVIILKTENPLDPAFVPVIMGSDIPKLEGIVGTGEIEAIEGYIKQIATIINQRNDNVTQSLIPAWLQNAGIEIINEEALTNLSSGVRIQVRAPLNVPLNTVLMPLPPPMVTQQSYMEVAGYEKNIQDRRGSYPYTRGESPQQRETATGIQELQAAGSMVAKFILMYIARTAFVQIPSQIIGWDRKFLDTRTILAVTRTREAGIPVFRHVSKENIQQDLQYIETVSAIDPEGTKLQKRAQLMQFLQIIGQVADRLPNVDFDGLVRKIARTFDEPGLESIVRRQAPPEGPGPGSIMLGGGESSAQQVALKSLLGRVPPTGGRASGGMLGKILGGMRGGR